MLHREVSKTALSITEDGAPILTCCYGNLERPTYFHPLYASNGQVVTEDENNRAQYPPGICFVLGTVNGERQAAYERKPTLAEAAEEFAIVTTSGVPEPLLTETFTTKVHLRQTEIQVLDIQISLHAPTTPLEIAGNTGLACRAVEMEYRKALNADGRLGESEVNGNKSAWGTLSGITTAQQNAVGVAIFPHPTNGETTFFADDLSYGFLFAEATPFTVDVGATRILKYRVLAYIGDLFTFDVWQYHEDYTGGR